LISRVVIFLSLAGCILFSYFFVYFPARDNAQVILVKSSYELQSGTQLSYFLQTYKPKNKKERFPLLVVMYAVGFDVDQTLAAWRKDARDHQMMLLVPDQTHPDAEKYYGAKAYIHLIEELVKKYPIDRRNIYLLGISKGALIGERMIQSNSDLFRGGILAANPDTDLWKVKKNQEGARYPSLLLIHGGADYQYPIQLVRRKVSDLIEKEVDVRLLEIPDAKHEYRRSWNSVILRWIELEREIQKSYS